MLQLTEEHTGEKTLALQPEALKSYFHLFIIFYADWILINTLFFKHQFKNAFSPQKVSVILIEKIIT